MKCFHHDDMDGQASAFCIHAFAAIHQDHSKNGEVMQQCQYIPIHYNVPFPFDTIIPGEQIWIVDYSISPEEMIKLLEITPDVTWIDHHGTAIAKYSEFPYHVRGIRKDGEAACSLTWKYLQWYTIRGEGTEVFTKDKADVLPVPRFLELIADRDVWRWEFGEETKYFFSGSQLHDTSPLSCYWWRVMEGIENMDFWHKLFIQGEAIEKYKHQYYANLNKSIGINVLFCGLSCRAINVARISSDVFGNLVKEYDIVIAYYYDGSKWVISMYSEKCDVSIIARDMGGGGHKGAAGFNSVVIPWTVVYDK